jgi:hypothetical protein
MYYDDYAAKTSQLDISNYITCQGGGGILKRLHVKVDVSSKIFLSRCISTYILGTTYTGTDNSRLLIPTYLRNNCRIERGGRKYLP